MTVDAGGMRSRRSTRRRLSLGLLGVALGVPASAAGLTSPDAEARLGAAARAEADGRLADAALEYRRVFIEDPDNDAAYRALHDLAERTPLERESNRYQAAHAFLGKFREYESHHYAVLSNAKASWTREQLARLERAHDAFQRHCRSLGLRPLPLRHKLVCVFFKSRDEYARFARSHDRMTVDWVYGYYTPRGDRVMLFDGEREEHADEFAHARAIATTLHEAIHQLHYHTHVQSMYVQYPLWIGEGLATAFETEDPTRTFGPEQEYAPRRRRFENLLERDELLSLSKLVRAERMPQNDVKAVHAFYCESYALVTWLVRNRPRELADYLERMLREPFGRPGADRHVELFEAAFGDIVKLEKAWLRDEERALADARLTRDPLEEQRLLAYLAWEDGQSYGADHAAVTDATGGAAREERP